ncbi:MAG: hypothetical protein GYA31_00510 [Parcubacteria group bacterium]|nr:hypothetical protein [Parcubacteria group bacterium]
MDWSNFTSQIGQTIIQIFTAISKLANQIFISGILYHLVVILKAIGKFILIILEAIVRLLKLIIK